MDISSLKLPPTQKKRGHPKGGELTVIGLPKKRKDDGPVAFFRKQPKEMERSFVYIQSFKTSTLVNLLKKKWLKPYWKKSSKLYR